MQLYIDLRPSQLLDKKQRGIGTYSYFLYKYIERKKLSFIHPYRLWPRFENIIPLYDPKQFFHRVIRKFQFILWLIDNKLLFLRLGSATVFHSVDQLFIPPVNSIKRIVTVHDIIPTVLPDYYNNLPVRLQKLYQQSIDQLPFVDHIITVSEFTKQELVTHLHLDHTNISVVYEAADPLFRVHTEHDCRILLSKQFNISDKFILFVGGIDKRKNVKTVIEVFNQLKKKHKDLKLVIVGSDFKVENDIERKEIDSLIKKYKLNTDIFGVGYVETDTLCCLYNSAELLLYPSSYEGFGLPVLEAFASGCPVVTSNKTSIPEIAGKNALLVDPENITQITKNVLRILNDKKFADLLRKKGIAHAREFSWNKTAEKTVAIYQKYLPL